MLFDRLTQTFDFLLLLYRLLNVHLRFLHLLLFLLFLLLFLFFLFFIVLILRFGRGLIDNLRFLGLLVYHFHLGAE